VDFGEEEVGAPPAKRPNSSLLEGAVYAMGALAGDPRANTHYMELHNEGVALRALCQAPSSSCSLNRHTYTPARPR
jgi:hypothetical protein